MIVREIVFIGFTRSEIFYSNVALSNTLKMKFSIWIDRVSLYWK